MGRAERLGVRAGSRVIPGGQPVTDGQSRRGALGKDQHGPE